MSPIASIIYNDDEVDYQNDTAGNLKLICYMTAHIIVPYIR